jgi:type IV secretion system protein VirB7
MWRRLSIICVVAWQLGGCAIWSKAPPSCDGLARRPLNRSLWDWETGTPLAAPEPPIPPSPPIVRKGDANPTPASTSAAMNLAPGGRIDLAPSYRPCGKET